MNYNQLENALKGAGFVVESTGGGCTAWQYERPDGLLVWLHQDLHHEVYPDLLETPDGRIEVGLNREWDTIKYYEADTMKTALNHVLELTK